MNGDLLMHLPEDLYDLVAGMPYETDDIGRSESTVLRLSDRVLKIEAHKPETDESVRMIRWMESRVPVPKVLYYGVEDGKSYLLMKRIPGHMACDEKQMQNREELHKLLSEALQLLWQTDIADCPRVRTLEEDLRKARERVEQGLVDRESFRPMGFADESFDSPEALLQWLESHVPDFDPVLCHGDLCLPNVLMEEGRVTGFIDLGAAAVYDRCSDIADCYWSLRANYHGWFGTKPQPDYDPEDFFRALPDDVDREKVRFFLLLGCLY